MVKCKSAYNSFHTFNSKQDVHFIINILNMTYDNNNDTATKEYLKLDNNAAVESTVTNARQIT